MILSSYTLSQRRKNKKPKFSLQHPRRMFFSFLGSYICGAQFGVQYKDNLPFSPILLFCIRCHCSSRLQIRVLYLLTSPSPSVHWQSANLPARPSVSLWGPRVVPMTEWTTYVPILHKMKQGATSGRMYGVAGQALSPVLPGGGRISASLGPLDWFFFLYQGMLPVQAPSAPLHHREGSFLVCFVVLGMELRALSKLGEHSTRATCTALPEFSSLCMCVNSQRPLMTCLLLTSFS